MALGLHALRQTIFGVLDAAIAGIKKGLPMGGQLQIDNDRDALNDGDQIRALMA
jgi:hypothetical protein